MSIDIDDNILGLWFVAWQGADWMAGLWKTPNGPEGKYRFRYYKDDKAFGSKDEKRWYVLKPIGAPQPDEEIVETLSRMAELICEANRGEKWELLRGTS